MENNQDEPLGTLISSVRSSCSRRADPKKPINAKRTLQNYGWNYGILY